MSKLSKSVAAFMKASVNKSYSNRKASHGTSTQLITPETAHEPDRDPSAQGPVHAKSDHVETGGGSRCWGR
jgi:hypothetical protein